MKELHELREMLCDELKEYGKKGELTNGSLDTVDKLTHTIKNLDKIIEADGYSNSYPWDGKRYAGNRYSRGGLVDKLRDLMGEAQDERTKMEIKRLIDKMD